MRERSPAWSGAPRTPRNALSTPAPSGGRGDEAAIDRHEILLVRQFANQAFSRASGAPLREHNRIRLLKDASENYPAWLAAIHGAQRSIHFEMYILQEDAQGRLFADALLQKARDGVQVRLLYDWMGAFGKTSRGFWRHLRAGGVEVRCYNPPRFDRPLGWLSRDHRKMIAVDGAIAFVTGLCVGQAWVGDPVRHLEPWRDTGVEVRGPAVADVEEAFAEAWATAGDPLPPESLVAATIPPAAAGDVSLRVVATVPYTAGLFRVDQLVAAMARNTLWLTDAYFAGTAPYVQALRAAAEDGVDVRLLVPGSSDLPLLRPVSRAGYRPLIEAGVRVFEWNGSMLHAKTAVADSRWARVGSTNLNLASWMGNRELDVIVEDERFARHMEEMFVADLGNATEVVLDRRNRVRAAEPAVAKERRLPRGAGSSGRVVAGAVRIGNTVGAAVTNRRVLEPVEANIALVAGAALLALAALAIVFPRIFAYLLAAIATWFATALLTRGAALRRERRRNRRG
ncbi:MAG TPA: phospholipase D-like domain-containing protein [Vicinamibacterales bacterium]|nr:phospholipase D-like domain-containing protein [Vicinamibacterales bacterium]